MSKAYIIIFAMLMVQPDPVLAQSMSQNYIKSVTMLDANGTDSLCTVQYYNGLGYPTLSVAMVGGSGQTAYTLTTYDGAGRESRKYLPVAVDKSVEYKEPNAVITSSATAYKDNTAYTRNHYDALDRVLSTELPGSAWRSADKRDRVEYAANTVSDNVRHYQARSTDNTLMSQDQNYSAGALSKETHKDADGKTVVTFRDLQGNVVLQRTAGNLDTYYVYDELGHLRFVLPPAFQASDKNANHAIYRYEYRYDKRGRVTTKILPGAEYTEYWHDNADRIICMQDAMMRKAGKYRFTVYDRFGRKAIQGLCSDYRNKTNHDANPAVMAVYEGQAGFLNTGYTVSDATSLFANAALEVVNYYDNHGFVSRNHGSRFTGLTAPASADATGLLTGSAVLAGNGEWTARVMGYDLLGNLTEIMSNELRLGTTIRMARRTNTYTFTNNLKGSTCTVGVGYGSNLTLAETYGYNMNNGKKSSYSLSIAHGGAAVSAGAAYAYNALGQLQTVTRSLSGSAVKTVGYAYDLHGWLKGITTNSFTEELFYADGPATRLYNGNISAMRWRNSTYANKRGYKFSYDAANRLTSAVYGEQDAISTNADRYSERVTEYDKNGNIRKLERRGKTQSGSYGVIDNLSISYDGNQLSSVTESAAELTYTGSLDYKGSKGSQYIYNENGSLVADKSRGIAYITYDYNNNPHQVYFTNGNVTRYVYSAEGQKLRVVHNTAVKNISRVLGVQPTELTAAQILYTDSTDYLLDGSLVMRNGRVDKYLFEEGYAQASVTGSTTDKFAFHYYNRDHLGNIREVVDASGAVKQVTNYYPFGAPYADTSSSTNPDFQPYKYNGKELDRMHGLDTYDYGARQYDPILARWDRVDPMAEKYYGISPYVYCANSPMKYIDPDGKVVETAWDIFNVGLDIASLSSNVKNGNVGAAIVDGICLVADVAATAVPFIPGGAGAAVKVARTAEKAVNVTKSAGTAKMTRLRKSAEIGQEAHRQIEREIIKNNPGARAEVTIPLTKNQKVRKDVVLADGKTVIIIKPNTKSGQKAAQKRANLMEANGYKPQKVFYDPNDPKYLPGSPTYIGPPKK